jgi:hypothetical protein
MADDEPLRIKVPLFVPVHHGDEELREIELIEPTFEALQTLDRAHGDMERGILTICACTGLPPSVVRQLRARDLKRVGEEAQKLLGEESPETGGNSGLGLPITSIGRRAN